MRVKEGGWGKSVACGVAVGKLMVVSLLFWAFVLSQLKNPLAVMRSMTSDEHWYPDSPRRR